MHLKKIYFCLVLGLLLQPQETQACSRITFETPKGVYTIRSLDWQDKLGGIAVIHPKNIERRTRSIKNSHYQTPATWKTKYTTLAIEEPNLFGYANSEAINIEGLSVSVLYLEDSFPFIKKHQDTQKPAINFKDIPSFIAENFKTVDEFLQAYEKGEFIEAWQDGINGYQHGLHYSVQDKYGKITLIQLGENGKTVIHKGTAKSDLRVMTNSPLQEEHRKYIAKFDLKSPQTNTKIPNSISSQARMLRGLYHTERLSFPPNATQKQIEGKIQALFDAGNLVPQGIIDEESGNCYPTWTEYMYNHNTGIFKFRNMETFTEISINIKELEKYKKPMQANLIEQTNQGLEKVHFTPYIEHQ